MTFFCQNSPNCGNTLRDRYQLVFISEQKKRWHPHHSQGGNGVIVHFVLEPIETWMLRLAEFGGGLKRPKQIVLLRFRLFVPAFCSPLLQLGLRLLVSRAGGEVVPNVPPQNACFLNITFSHALGAQLIRVINDLTSHETASALRICNHSRELFLRASTNVSSASNPCRVFIRQINSQRFV